MPNTIITYIKVTDKGREAFIKWQAELHQKMASFEGFLSLEIAAPSQGQSCWSLIQRFVDEESADAWKSSALRKKLFLSLKGCEIREIITEDQRLKGVTEVIITQISPQVKKSYSEWLAKVHAEEAAFKGFQGMYVQAPTKGKDRFWITFLQFDSSENLERWLGSERRQELLKELDPLAVEMESHRLLSPYAGWFQSIENNGTPIAVWKQTLLVLLVLFPIVMLEIQFLNPLTKNLNPSLGMFIGNTLSVTLISWPMLPLAIFCFRWWLAPNLWKRRRMDFLGLLLLIVIYCFEIIIFW